jgi:hypothetical protein
MDNTVILGLFAAHKIISEYVGSISTPKEVLPYSPNTPSPRDIKVTMSANFRPKPKIQ